MYNLIFINKKWIHFFFWCYYIKISCHLLLKFLLSIYKDKMKEIIMGSEDVDNLIYHLCNWVFICELRVTHGWYP